MTSPEPFDAERARAMTRTFGLDLPPDRIETLVHTYSEFLDSFAEIWALDLGDREPATITYSDEAERDDA